jgi:hypothetical protein
MPETEEQYNMIKGSAVSFSLAFMNWCKIIGKAPVKKLKMSEIFWTKVAFL